MPTYAELLQEVAPSVIETDEQYDSISKQLGELMRVGTRRSQAETRLMRLLAVLVEDFDRRNALPALEEPAHERLRFLLEASGKTAADLLPVFSQRSHVHEALTGSRSISAPQARKLSAIFKVRPGYFF